jgi:hypothetical protein
MPELLKEDGVKFSPVQLAHGDLLDAAQLTLVNAVERLTEVLLLIHHACYESPLMNSTAPRNICNTPLN